MPNIFKLCHNLVSQLFHNCHFSCLHRRVSRKMCVKMNFVIEGTINNSSCFHKRKLPKYTWFQKDFLKCFIDDLELSFVQNIYVKNSIFVPIALVLFLRLIFIELLYFKCPLYNVLICLNRIICLFICI